MDCQRCHGCVLYNPGWCEHYCVNCGNRPCQPTRTYDPVRDGYRWPVGYKEQVEVER